MRRLPDQPAIPCSEGREFSKPLIRFESESCHPRAAFSTRLGASAGARSHRMQGIPRRLQPFSRGKPGGRRRTHDQMQAVGSRPGNRAHRLRAARFSSTAAGSRTVTNSRLELPRTSRMLPRPPSAPMHVDARDQPRVAVMPELSGIATGRRAALAAARGFPRRADRRSGPTTTCTAPSASRSTPREPSAVSAGSSMRFSIVQHQAQARGARFDRAQVGGVAQRANPARAPARRPCPLPRPRLAALSASRPSVFRLKRTMQKRNRT